MEVDTDAAAPIATQDTTTTWTFSDATKIAFYESLKEPFVKLLLLVFVASWQAQLTTYKKKAVDNALLATAKRIMGTDATNKSAQFVDAEPSTGPKKIKELINQAVNSKTQKMQTELNRLSKKLQRSKNGTGGSWGPVNKQQQRQQKRKERRYQNERQKKRKAKQQQQKTRKFTHMQSRRYSSFKQGTKQLCGRTSQRKNNTNRRRSSSGN